MDLLRGGVSVHSSIGGRVPLALSVVRLVSVIQWCTSRCYFIQHAVFPFILVLILPPSAGPCRKRLTSHIERCLDRHRIDVSRKPLSSTPPDPPLASKTFLTLLRQFGFVEIVSAKFASTTCKAAWCGFGVAPLSEVPCAA